MFFLKTKITDEIEIRVPIYGDEIFTICPDCGKEIEADSDLLADIFKDGGNLESTSLCCKECSAIRIPEKQPVL